MKVHTMFSKLDQWQVHDGEGRRKYLNDAEWAHFLRAADRLGPEARTFCYVLAYTGCRVSEALALTRPQLDPFQHALTIRTLKRRRTVFRVVPIPAKLEGMLLDLPVRLDGRFWGMHRSTAWRQVHLVMERAGIEGPMACCRGLRHGFGMHAAGVGVPLNLIQRWMGHASLRTTAIYLDAVGIEERKFAERMW